MTTAPELNARTGELRLAEPAFATLVSHVNAGHTMAGEPPAAEEAHEHLRLLRAAGALDEYGRVHPSLTETLATIGDEAPGAVELAYKGKAMRGWFGKQTAAMLLPAGEDGRCLLTSLPLPLLPGALGRLADLSHRPRPEPARPVSYHQGALADVRRHWQASVTWHENGVGDKRTLEVVDTEGGLWVIQSGEHGEKVAWPSTPTRVWRLLVRLVTGEAS